MSCWDGNRPQCVIARLTGLKEGWNIYFPQKSKNGLIFYFFSATSSPAAHSELTEEEERLNSQVMLGDLFNPSKAHVDVLKLYQESDQIMNAHDQRVYLGRILFPDRAVSIWSRLTLCFSAFSLPVLTGAVVILSSILSHLCRCLHAWFVLSSVLFPVPSSVSSSLLGTCCSLACGPRDVVLINSPDCTLIKLSVNGPAPGFPPGVRQDGSHRKQLQIYGTAVAAARPALPVEPGNGEATACNSTRKCHSARCGHFIICVLIFVWHRSHLFFFSAMCNLHSLLRTKCMFSLKRAPRYKCASCAAV